MGTTYSAERDEMLLRFVRLHHDLPHCGSMVNSSRPSLSRDKCEIVPLVEFESFRLSDDDEILRLCIEEFRARYGSPV